MVLTLVEAREKRRKSQTRTMKKERTRMRENWRLVGRMEREKRRMARGTVKTATRTTLKSKMSTRTGCQASDGRKTAALLQNGEPTGKVAARDARKDMDSMLRADSERTRDGTRALRRLPSTFLTSTDLPARDDDSRSSPARQTPCFPDRGATNPCKAPQDPRGRRLAERYSALSFF